MTVDFITAMDIGLHTPRTVHTMNHVVAAP